MTGAPRARKPRPRWVAFASLLMLGGLAHAQPEPEELVLVTSDSARVAAFWYPRSSAGAPVAVLLHGVAETHHVWRPLVSPLFRNGFSVLSLDLRGHGRSQALNPEISAAMERRSNAPFREVFHDAEAAID